MPSGPEFEKLVGVLGRSRRALERLAVARGRARGRPGGRPDRARGRGPRRRGRAPAPRRPGGGRLGSRRRPEEPRHAARARAEPARARVPRGTSPALRPRARARRRGPESETRTPVPPGRSLPVHRPQGDVSETALPQIGVATREVQERGPPAHVARRCAFVSASKRTKLAVRFERGGARRDRRARGRRASGGRPCRRLCHRPGRPAGSSPSTCGRNPPGTSASAARYAATLRKSATVSCPSTAIRGRAEDRGGARLEARTHARPHVARSGVRVRVEEGEPGRLGAQEHVVVRLLEVAAARRRTPHLAPGRSSSRSAPPSESSKISIRVSSRGNARTHAREPEAREVEPRRAP